MSTLRSSLLVVPALVLACGQPAPPPRVAITEPGTPTGAPTTRMIGPEGGTLTSADGLLSLTIPAGAISSPTMFSVTPITATGPGGVQAWRLGPEGTRFSSPATISMRYDEAEAKATEPRFLRIAFQDAQRRWRPLTTTVDEATRTLSGSTTHLSDWTKLRGFSLTPGQAQVKVRESQNFILQSCDFGPPETVEGDELAPIAFDCAETELAPLRSEAAVNGVQGGNATYGTVQNRATRVGYTAPFRKPSPAVVAVSLRFNTKDGLTTVVSNVRITDDQVEFPEQLTGTFTLNADFGGPGTGSTKLRYAAMGNATFTNRDAEGRYQGSGTLMVTSGFVELPDCDCDLMGGSAAFTGSLLLTSSRYDWGYSTDVTLPISCRRRSGGSGTCPSQYLVPVLFESGDDGCPGTATTTYDDPKALMGSFSRACTRGPVQATWSFSGP
ncbi:MAG: hypothetical protein SFW67_29740 [Myxococcaceae bacterium]|nr:hypothetical protein [Myxococcaceae bacterium]